MIPFACNACETTCYEVTDNCQGCLAHPCSSVCPVKAISIVDGRSTIDKEKCLKCGRCADTCPYHAIIKRERPCAAACGVGAIESDELGRAKINYDKCVSCGQCLVSCPFAAIADKSQILQLILALKSDEEVIAEIAPAFVGQFGPLATPAKVKAALLEIGFSDVYEVANGADDVSVSEAEEFFGAGAGRASVSGNILLSVLVRICKVHSWRQACKLRLYVLDANGCDGAQDQSGASECTGLLYWAVRFQKAGGIPPDRGAAM